MGEVRQAAEDSVPPHGAEAAYDVNLDSGLDSGDKGNALTPDRVSDLVQESLVH